MSDKKPTKTQQALEREQAKGRLLVEMTKHIGKGKVIGMGELYERVFQEGWRHRINDTRRLRKLITGLRTGETPAAICSTCCAIGPGYYLAQTGPELEAYIEKIKKQALKKLLQAARLQKVPLPELLGQMALKMRGGEN